MAPRARITVEELLMRHRAITEEQLQRARDEQKRLGGDVGRTLVDLGYVSEELLLRAQAHQMGLPLVEPARTLPPPELIQGLPVQLAERFLVVPVGGNLAHRILRVATCAPGNAEAVTELARATGCKIELAVATAKSIEQAIRAAYYGEQPEEAHPEIHPEPEPAGVPDQGLGELRARLDKAEQQLGNRQYAAALARIERLEQIAESDHHALNVLGQVLLEVGAISREDLKKRLARA